MPDHVEDRLLERHPEFQQHDKAMALVLADPFSVNLRSGTGGVPEVRIIASADRLRVAGYLRSRSIGYVDLLVELRSVDGETLSRAFHLAPTRRFESRRLIWP